MERGYGSDIEGGGGPSSSGFLGGETKRFVVLGPSDYVKQWVSVLFCRDRSHVVLLLEDLFWTAYVIPLLGLSPVMTLASSKGVHPYTLLERCKKEYERLNEKEQQES